MKSILIFVSAVLVATANAIAQPMPGTPAAAPAAPATTCDTCGSVESVRYVEQKGEASGAGLVAGGVVGGVLGHQIGSGRGNTAATIAGAGIGAYAGNQVEKNVKKKSYYVVTVALDKGGKKSVNQSSKPALQKGDRVKIVDGNRLALLAN
jgi:outer membrane lipoprotein SlyB